MSILASGTPAVEAATASAVPLDQCGLRDTSLATMEIGCQTNDQRQSNVTSAYLADRFAPILWFSPDEPLLERSRAIPDLLPGDRGVSAPVVYYQVTSSLSRRPRGEDGMTAGGETRDPPFELGELSRASGSWLKIRYFFYYSEDVGANSHPHDLESADFRLRIVAHDDQLVLRLDQVVGFAHGLGWSANKLRLTKTATNLCTESTPPKGEGCGAEAGRPCECDTVFPFTLLVEEGKHATCPDRNGDGAYNPGYDVNYLPNEAWGVRDDFGQRLIHRTYEARMTKRRQVQDRRFPPLGRVSMDERNALKQRYERFSRNPWTGDGTAADRGGSAPAYTLRSTAEAARAMLEDPGEANLVGHLVCIGDGLLGKHFDENDFYSSPRTLTRAWRWSREHTSFEFTRRQQEGLVTLSVGGWDLLEQAGFGGWIVPRVTLATAPLLGYRKGPVFRRIEVLYTRTASRWLEYYGNLNFNLNRRSDPELDRQLVPELGLKLRFQLAELVRGTPHFFIGARFGVQVERKEANGPHSLRFVWQVGGGPW